MLTRYNAIVLVILFIPAMRMNAAEPIVLSNRGVSLRIDPSSGRLIDGRNQLTAETYDLSELIAFDLQVDGSVVSPSNMSLAEAHTDSGVRFIFRGNDLEVTIGLVAPPDGHFVEKTIQVKNTGAEPRIIDRVVMWRMQTKNLIVQPHRHPSVYAPLINIFLAGEKGGLFAGVENPFVELLTPSGQFELSYRPRWRLDSGETFTGEPAFLGAYRKEGVYAFKELGRLATVVKQGNVPPLTARMEQEVLDWGQIWAMQAFIEAIQPPQEFRRPGYYLRVIGPVNNVDVGKRFADTVAVIEHIPHIEWNTWTGQVAAESMGIGVESTGANFRFQPNLPWQEVATYARSKGLYSGSMEAVPNMLYGARPERLVRRRDGEPWRDGQTERICMANPQFVQAYVQAYDRLVSANDLYMVAWDSTAWMWLKWPDPTYECYADNHGHPPGDVRYHVWRQLMHLFAELHHRHPQLAMRMAAGLQPGYPWILKDLIEHHTSFYDNEPGGSWWRSRNQLFIPAYKCTTTMAAGTWPELRYNFFRSLSIADHAMMWGVDVSIGRFGLPMEADQRVFFRKWMNWADQNLAFLRVRRDLFREPWGDEAVNANRVDMEGSFPSDDPQIHGSAHCIGDRGFLFLFNPSSKERTSRIPVNHWLGLTEGKRFIVREIFPADARSLGQYDRGDSVDVEVAPGAAMVLAIEPAKGVAASMRPAASSSDTPVDSAFYEWSRIPWREIMVP